MTKRSRNICTILAVIFTFLLQVATIKIMKYDTFSMIVSTVLYFASILFAVIDVYCTFKKGFNKHHFFSAIRDIGTLGAQLTIYYILGNMETMGTLDAMICSALVLILCYIVIKFGELAKKNCTYTYTG